MVYVNARPTNDWLDAITSEEADDFIFGVPSDYSAITVEDADEDRNNGE